MSELKKRGHIRKMYSHDCQHVTCICREGHGNNPTHLDIFLVNMCLAGNEYFMYMIIKLYNVIVI